MALALAACSSPSVRNNDECVDSASSEIRTCAKGTTLTGIDVSSYQGTVNWSQVKASGRAFAFVRVSDGLDYPDSKFAQNWPSAKAAGLVRGVYQYFRPGQDPAAQAKLVLDKLAAAGGLHPGDLPPVIDLETTDKLSSSVVVARAKAWISAIEKATGEKPIVYTAAFMSDVIGTAFSGYRLWVANYGATCPWMPTGWTDWHFWQNSDSGSVPGVSGNVDTNFFNGTLPELHAITLKPAAPVQAITEPAGDGPMPMGARPRDGSEGATVGESNPAPSEAPPEPADPPCGR